MLLHLKNIFHWFPSLPSFDIPLNTKIWLLDLTPYLFLGFVLIVIIIFLFIRAKYGFWSYQPVFHPYDLIYFFWKKGIICDTLPKPNKFTNFENIVTIPFQNLTELKRIDFSHFIQKNYFREKNNFFEPKRENIEPYFIGFNDPCYISFYRENQQLLDLKQNNIKKMKHNIGVISTRPIHLHFTNYKNKEMKAYYVDYLCVEKSQRKKGIAAQLIQTHHYYQSHNNKSIVVSLFKRENELTGIVPLCSYYTYGFPVLKWRKPPKLSPEFSVLRAIPSNFHLFADFIKSCFSLFEISITHDEGNSLELIKTGNVYIYGILQDHEIKAMYWLRKTCIFVDKGMEVLCCFCSVNKSLDQEIFLQGFKNMFWETANKHNFGYCSIESIAHNDIIIQNLKKKTHPEIVSPTAYFFYNFIYNTVPSSKCFILI